MTVDTTNPRTLQSAFLRIGQGVGNFGDLDKGTGAEPPEANFTGYDQPVKQPFAPQSGVGPGLVAWVDNTLGAFSPYQNRIYMAYSTGNEVHLMYSDGVDPLGGSLWNNAPIVVGQGYLPQVTVDETTGTLALAYYTTRYDSSNTRSTMVLQTAVNQADFRDRFGTIERLQGNWAAAQTWHERSLAGAREAGDRAAAAAVLGNLADVVSAQGDEVAERPSAVRGSAG